MTVREWLPANDYGRITDLIDGIMASIKANGSRERRSWGQILAGGKNGRPRVVAGGKFPVLAAAQIAYGLPVTPNAIRKSEDEVFPPKKENARWPKRHRKPKSND